MDLEEIYNQKHQKGLERIISENEFIDENLNNENDTRRGIQLLRRPSEKVITSIQEKAKEIKKIDPNLYIYNPECLHFTLFSFIHVTKDFNYTKEQVELFKKISNEVLSNFKKFKITNKGLMFTSKAILVKGYPEKIIYDILTTLNKALANNNISRMNLYKDIIFHSSLVRYKTKISNRDKLIKFISDNYYYDFGTFDVSEIELIYHDWYDTKREVLDKIKLL